MPSRCPARFVLAAIAAILSATATLAQVVPSTRDSPNLYPSALPPRKGPPPPRVEFRLEAQIPIPSPLPGARLETAGGRIRIETDRGAVEVAPEAGSEPVPAEPRADAVVSPWVLSDDGRFRVRALAEGRVEAEKKSRRARSRWRKEWSLRVAGRTLSPPALLGRRVFFGSVNGQVHCVRLENGHRIWSADLGDRVTMGVSSGALLPSAAPEGPPTSGPALEFVLAVPDDGASLMALDAYDGNRLAGYDVGRQEMLVTAPLLLPDGRVAVARVGYVGESATLLLLRLHPLPAETAKGAD